MATRAIAPLIVITGPTASGKTALAIKLAEEFDGEIISADSRAIYKAMDIGTAKPTREEQARVSHHGIDLVEPSERYTVADFKAYAEQKINEIRMRGHIPFLVGGTGLYVSSVIYNYQFGGVADPVLREKLADYSTEELHEYCFKNNIKLPENDQNKRYIIRAIERANEPTTSDRSLIDNIFVVGIATEKEELRRRIRERAEHLLENGVVEETHTLSQKYGWQNEAMTANIYPLIKRYVDGELTRDEFIEAFTARDWQLAKRQLTWLRRLPDVKWLTLGEADIYLTQLLAKYHSPVV